MSVVITVTNRYTGADETFWVPCSAEPQNLTKLIADELRKKKRWKVRGPENIHQIVDWGGRVCPPELVLKNGDQFIVTVGKARPVEEELEPLLDE